MKVRQFLKKIQKQHILAAIIQAEKMTSGEIRVHLEASCSGDALRRARQVFSELKMQDTQLHNGILIYLAVSDRKLAIFGDQGIDDVVAQDLWQDIKDKMLVYFDDGNFTEGIITGINLIGAELKKHFQYDSKDINELPDDLSINDEK